MFICFSSLRYVCKAPELELPVASPALLVRAQQMPDAIFSMLRQNTTLIRRVKTLKEVNLEFCAPESSTFHLDIPNSLPLMYGDAPSPTLAMDTARKLMTLCVSLNEYPNIRYQTSSRFCEQVANSLLVNILTAMSTGRSVLCSDLSWPCLCKRLFCLLFFVFVFDWSCFKTSVNDRRVR